MNRFRVTLVVDNGSAAVIYWGTVGAGSADAAGVLVTDRVRAGELAGLVVTGVHVPVDGVLAVVLLDVQPVVDVGSEPGG